MFISLPTKNLDFNVSLDLFLWKQGRVELLM